MWMGMWEGLSKEDWDLLGEKREAETWIISNGRGEDHLFNFESQYFDS